MFSFDDVELTDRASIHRLFEPRPKQPRKEEEIIAKFRQAFDELNSADNLSTTPQSYVCYQNACLRLFTNIPHLSKHITDGHIGYFPCGYKRTDTDGATGERTELICRRVFGKKQSRADHYKKAHGMNAPKVPPRKRPPLGHLDLHNFILHYIRKDLPSFPDFYRQLGDLPDYKFNQNQNNDDANKILVPGSNEQQSTSAFFTDTPAEESGDIFSHSPSLVLVENGIIRRTECDQIALTESVDQLHLKIAELEKRLHESHDKNDRNVQETQRLNDQLEFQVEKNRKLVQENSNVLMKVKDLEAQLKRIQLVHNGEVSKIKADWVADVKATEETGRQLSKNLQLSLDKRDATIKRLNEEKLERVKLKLNHNALNGEIGQLQAELKKETKAKNLLVKRLSQLDPKDVAEKSKKTIRFKPEPSSEDNAKVVDLRKKLKAANDELKIVRDGLQYILSTINLPRKAPVGIAEAFHCQLTKCDDEIEAFVRTRTENFISYLGYVIQHSGSAASFIRPNINRLLSGIEAFDIEASRAIKELDTLTQGNDTPKLGKVGLEMVKRFLNFPPRNPMEVDYYAAPCFVDGANVCRAYVTIAQMSALVHGEQIPAQKQRLDFRILLNWVKEAMQRRTFVFINVVLPYRDMFGRNDNFLYSGDSALAQLHALDDDENEDFRIIYAMGNAYDDIIPFVLAYEYGGVIVSNDRFRDLLGDNPTSKVKPLYGLFAEYGLKIYQNAAEHTATFTFEEEGLSINMGADPNGKSGKTFPQMIVVKKNGTSTK